MTAQSTEARHPASAGFHALTDAQALSTLLDAQMSALTAVRAAFPALEQAAARSVDVLRAGGKMAYAGAGSSGLMALADSLELAGTFGIAPDRTPLMFAGGAAALLHLTGAVEDDPELARADVVQAGIGAGDVVLCLSASGTTPYTLVVAREAAACGATIVGFANVAGSALLDLADIPVLLDTGPEVVSGSTRMGAATAQKAALNLLSALVGVRLGHVHDGYMVSLIADNAKLVDRAARIVADISGVSRAMAEAALAQTGGAVKPAILVARGQSPAEAKAALAESGGHLPATLTR
ncbi:N-acetylmuramic acid 6-phosphate etherase [Gemmobacter fulvus]|uniref:N-acetylmuramic acid 6-phosphate etherase n=1 Tax=Gemmobacter fulvus TaxID=2840474 RepID=UPI0027964297|nr:N-acetylmuramic acid 6-phosphate etherase [Gemmobacter fulvus]MDQ1846660.1 N-acetylmuramic acid 6-phosphate etherase [Gemmobacter fulvus]